MEPVLSLFKIKKKERKRENENKGKESPFLFTLRSKIARGDTRLTAREDPRIVPFSRSKKKEKERQRERVREKRLARIYRGRDSPSCGGHEDLIDEERRFPWWRSAAAWKVR